MDEQRIDALWHTISNKCDKGHYMIVVSIQISRYANLNISWSCIGCGTTLTEQRSMVTMLADCTELDMLSTVVAEAA